LDTTIPKVTITSPPLRTTSARRPHFTFTADEDVTYACRIDEAPSAPCTAGDGFRPDQDVRDGSRTFTVVATDRAGNAGFAREWFTVDSTAPRSHFSKKPKTSTNDPNPSFTISTSEPGTSLACWADGVPLAVCSPGQAVNLGPLEDGAHEFRVQGTDAVGNVEEPPATYRYTVDTHAPETTITRRPEPYVLTSTRPEFWFASSEPGVTYSCRLDGKYAACPNASYRAGYLNEGTHTFTVAATDAATNRDPTPAEVTFRVVRTMPTAPETSITSGPGPLTNDPQPRFTLSSDRDEATFECALDGAPFGPCSGGSEHALGPLADGVHEFAARAVTEIGSDQTPASATFSVDTTFPETTITTGPESPATDRTPTFDYSSTEPDEARFECSMDGERVDCTGPRYESSALTAGDHVFQVVALDRAGNRDPSPAIWAFTINDPVLPPTDPDPIGEPFPPDQARDVRAPQTVLAKSPPRVVRTSRRRVSLRFEISSDEALSMVLCRVGGAPVEVCTMRARLSVASSRTRGSRRSASFYAVDLAGNVDPIPAVWRGKVVRRRSAGR
jgi:hypothetical protein